MVISGVVLERRRLLLWLMKTATVTLLFLLPLLVAGCQSESPSLPPPGEVLQGSSGAGSRDAYDEGADDGGPQPVESSTASLDTAPLAPAVSVPGTKLPQTDAGYPEAIAALPFFARPVSAGWHFPTTFHYHEWRHAVGLRQRPDTLTDPSGRVLRLTRGSGRARLVILIDDLGNSSWSLHRIAELPFPVNGAILPYTPLASRAARTILATGGDVLLHQPLEPFDYPRHNPGQGALFVTMSTEQRVATLLDSWASVPDRIGLNNHMGSRYTADEAAMADIARALADQSPIFVDSRTVPRSKAHSQMILHGISSLGRTHFLDDVPNVEAIQDRLGQAISAAQSQGAALVIGHPNRATLQVLEEAEPLFREGGIEVVSLQDLFGLDP